MPSYQRNYCARRNSHILPIENSPIEFERMPIRRFEITKYYDGVILRDLDHPNSDRIFLAVSYENQENIDRSVQHLIDLEQQNQESSMPSVQNLNPVWNFDPRGGAEFSQRLADEMHIPASDWSEAFSTQCRERLEQRIVNELDVPVGRFCASPVVPPKRKRKYLTWVPYSSYQKCASCFADQDLKLMRAIVLRVLKYLHTHHVRRQNRAAELWRGHEQSLIRYGLVIALECRRRGFQDKSLETLQVSYRLGRSEKPRWVYWPALQESHRAYLLLREERRNTIKLINRGRQEYPQLAIKWPTILTFCHDLGLDYKRDWSLSDVMKIRSIFESHRIFRSDPNYYRHKFGWQQIPNEEFRYPGDNVC